MIRTYKQAVKFLEKYIPQAEKKHPGKLGFERMKNLVSRLNNPQDSFKTIHVGGTAGKGSTATLIASILATKFKTGIHTSPHLEKVNERIRVGENNISDDDFVKIISELASMVEKMEVSSIGPPSYFEIITAVAFLYFKKQKVDFGVIEVGMGGTYDATNVIKPEVAVLTNAGLDHTEVLGETVEEIGRDKAGIIKPGIKVVSGIKQESVKKIIQMITDRQKAKSEFLGEDFRYEIKKITDAGSYFDYFGENKYKNLFIPMLGAHQVENATLAIKTVEEIYDLRFKIYEEDIRRGLESAFIPGRLEIVKRNPLIILDGAHNPDKIRALVEAVKTMWPGKKVKLVLAIKEGKSAEEMLSIILKISKKVILTKFESLIDQGKILSFNPEKLSRMIKKQNYRGEIRIISRAKNAVDEAASKAKLTDIILITGSLYLIGQIREKFIKL